MANNDLLLKIALEGDKLVIKGLKDVENQSKKTGKGAKGAGKDAQDLGDSFKNVYASAKKLVAGMVALQGARKAVDLGRLSASAQTVERAFRNLAEQPDQMLQSMKKATAGTIAEMELMQQFNSASLLGLPLDRFDEMLTIARSSAQATGQSMDFMLNSIVTGLGRGSKLMLDNLGIMIDTQKAYEDYAEALDKTADELTDVEKKQAFVNSALDIGTKNVERTGGVIDSNIDVYGRFTSATQDLAIEFGEALAPMVENVLGSLTNFMNSLDSTKLKQYASALTGISIAYGVYTGAVNLARLRTIKFQATLVKTGWGALVVGAGLAIGKLIEMTGVFGNLRAEARLANLEFQKLSQRSWQQLTGSEQAEKLKETGKQLRGMFESGSKGSKLFEQAIKGIAIQMNSQGIAIKDLDKQFDVLVKNGIIKRKEQSDGETSAHEKWLAEQRKKGETIDQELAWKEDLKKSNEALARQLGFFADEEKRLTEIKQAQQEVYRTNQEFQFQMLEEQAQKYRELGIEQNDIDNWVAQSKTEIALKQKEEQDAIWNASWEAYDTFVNSMLDKSMTAGEKQQRIWESFRNSVIKFSAEMLKDWIKNEIIKRSVAKAGESTAIASALATGKSVAVAYATGASLASTATFGASAVTGQSALMSSILATKAVALSASKGGQFETDGPQMLIVGDNPSGRERVTVEPLGGDPGFQASNNVVVNISAPLIDETVRDSIMPEIQKALNQELS